MVLLELLVIGWLLYKFVGLFEGSPEPVEPDDLDLLMTGIFEPQDEEEAALALGFADCMKEKYYDTFVGSNLVSAEDMERLHDSGYDPIDVEFMDSAALKEAMEDAGVDTWTYDFDD